MVPTLSTVTEKLEKLDTSAQKMQGQRCDRDVEARVVSIPDIYIIFIFVYLDTSIGWV